MNGRRHFEYISTSTLRAMSHALSKRPWSKLLRRYRLDIDQELLARDLPALAEESGGYPCVAVGGLQ